MHTWSAVQADTKFQNIESLTTKVFISYLTIVKQANRLFSRLNKFGPNSQVGFFVRMLNFKFALNPKFPYAFKGKRTLTVLNL